MRSYIRPSPSQHYFCYNCNLLLKFNTIWMRGLEFCTINATYIFCGKGGPDEIPSSKHPSSSAADGTSHAASPAAWCATAAQDKNLSKVHWAPASSTMQIPSQKRYHYITNNFLCPELDQQVRQDILHRKRFSKELNRNCQHLCFPHEGLCLKFLFYSPVGNHWFYFSYRKHVLS